MRNSVKPSEALIAIVAAVTALFSITRNSAAMDITENSSCSVAVNEFDQRTSVSEIVTTITNVMVRLDDGYENAGSPSVLAPLSGDGLTSVVSLAIENCRDSPRMRLGEAAAKAYSELRASEVVIGGH